MYNGHTDNNCGYYVTNRSEISSILKGNAVMLRKTFDNFLILKWTTFYVVLDYFITYIRWKLITH